MASVTLTAYNLADSTEFDAWVAYVADHIDDATGLCVSVDCFDVSGCPARDRVRGTEAEREKIREVLFQLWESFCE